MLPGSEVLDWYLLDVRPELLTIEQFALSVRFLQFGPELDHVASSCPSLVL